MTRRLLLTLSVVLVGGALSAPPASAGNIALTGHDDDFHCFGAPGSSAACTQLVEMIAFARSGSSTPTLPVLVFEEGVGGFDLTPDLTAAGIPFTLISSPAAVDASDFDSSAYSAFVVASDFTCGGCSNTPAMTAALTAQSAAIASFFNAGGGIVGLAGGSNAATYYGFLPSSASGFGSPPSTGYVAATPTCFGTPITPVNGNATHNFFPEPGTGGVSSLYCVAERLGSATTGTAMTLLLQGGSIITAVIVTTTPTTTGPVPEPVTLTMVGLGLVGAAYQYRRRRV